ncbi:MAG: beta strand repeat-containing protein, partial [Acidimicrobiales bacterium]
PTVSDINLSPANPAGAQPNLVIGTLSSTGTVDVYNNAGSMDLLVDVSGYFGTVVPTVTTSYTVTPTSEQLPTVSTSTSTSGDVTYTVTGINSTNTPSGTVDIALFPSTGTDAPVQTNGSWTFVSNGGTGAAGSAAGQGTTDAATPSLSSTCASSYDCTGYIASVNGVPTTAPATQANGLSATNGTLTFVVNSFELDGTIPVVYTVPTGGAANTLMVGTNGEPQSGYAFGVGGATQWIAATAPAGVYSNYYVIGADPALSGFEACTSPTGTGTCWSFSYANSGDTFSYPSPNSTSSPYGTISLSASQFGADLSGPEASSSNDNQGAVTPDMLSSISYNPGGVSSFTYGFDVPAAPTAVTATAGSTGVVVSWTAPPNQDVSQDTTNTARYTVYRATVTSGVVGSFSELASCLPATAQVTGQPPETNCTDATAVAGTTYEYAVSATANKSGSDFAVTASQFAGPLSAASAQVTPPTAPSAALAPLSVSTAVGYGSGDTAGTLSTGDVLTVTFNGPVTLDSSSFSLNLTDGTNTGTVDNANATATLTNSGTTVVYTITAPVATTPSAFSFSTANPLEILSATGVSNTVGTWNLAGSGATNVSGVTRVFGGVNSIITAPVAPDVSVITTSATSVNVTCNNGTTSSTAYVYSENGVALGNAACDGSTAVAVPVTATVTASSVLLVNVQAGTTSAPTGYIGLSALTLGVSPYPIATTASLTTNDTVTVDVLTLPGASVSLSFVPVTGGGTATVSSCTASSSSPTSLSSAATTCTANAAGEVVITYKTPASLPSSGTDTITAANASSSPTYTATDTYTY